MTLHLGARYEANGVGIGPADPRIIRDTSVSVDVADDLAFWVDQATLRADVYYFSVFYVELLVGQIFLHDMNSFTGEALIGYHLFQPTFRGKGIGSMALTLLQRYVLEQTDLAYLTIITFRDNTASRRVAEKCGFTLTGPARESRDLVVFHWSADRDVPYPETGDERLLDRTTSTTEDLDTQTPS